MTVSLRELRTEYDGILTERCPSRVLLDHVTSKWAVLVLAALATGTLRWGELRREVGGISEKMLASTLRTLEADGLVHREPHATIPPRVDYSLTGTGDELVAAMSPLLRWVAEHVDLVER